MTSQPTQATPQPGQATVDPTEMPVPYDGDEFDCSICVETLEEGQRALRLQCRHVYHEQCWTRALHNGQQTCPNCRGAAQVVAIWNFIGPRPEPTQGQPNLLTVGQDTTVQAIETPRSMITEREFNTPGDWDTVDGAFPALPASSGDATRWTSSLATGESTSPGSSNVLAYAAETEMADGRQALLIDPGSWGNLAGDQWVKRAAALAIKSGKKPTQERRSQPLNLRGVGHGTQACSHDVRIPIALERTDGSSTPGTFTTPTVNNSGLPALLGLKTMLDRRAILDLPNMQLHLLGPGDAELRLPPGSESYQLHHAPSGHLMLPCCEYKRRIHADAEGEDLALVTRPARTGENNASGGSAASSSSSPPS